MSVSKDEIVREEIINHAQKLFQQFGLKKTTMDEIAEASGKAKSTLYHYFTSKEEVFEAVIQNEMTSLRALVKNHVEEKKTVEDKMTVYFIKFHEEILNMMNIYRIAKYEIRDERKSRAYFLKLIEFEQAYLSRILEDGFDAGEIKSIDKEDIPWFAETMVAAFFGIVRYAIEKEREFDPDKLTKIARNLVPRLFN
ncbi:MAG: TetR/AcrR family transcriptional regulator [Cytophagales bacterium]|nr:TetR/AcrR family transcriptional regulator [Cytophagales bacterium]